MQSAAYKQNRNADEEDATIIVMMMVKSDRFVHISLWALK